MEFRDSYEDLVPRLLGFLTANLGDRDAAQDLLQETLIRFWRSPFYRSAEEKSPEEARRYAFRIAFNLLKDRHKAMARYARTIAAFEEERQPPRIEPMSDLSFDMERALRELKPRDRTLLWMAHAESYTHAEIAEVLGYSPMSIRVLLSRARKRLRKIVEDLDQPHPWVR